MGILDLVIVLISFIHATFMKMGENDSTHELARMLQASSEFKLIFFVFVDNLHLQIIESIFPKAFPQSICREFICPVGYINFLMVWLEFTCLKCFVFLQLKSFIKPNTLKMQFTFTFIPFTKLPLARIHSTTRYFFSSSYILA